MAELNSQVKLQKYLSKKVVKIQRREKSGEIEGRRPVRAPSQLFIQNMKGGKFKNHLWIHCCNAGSVYRNGRGRHWGGWPRLLSDAKNFWDHCSSTTVAHRKDDGLAIKTFLTALYTGAVTLSCSPTFLVFLPRHLSVVLSAEFLRGQQKARETKEQGSLLLTWKTLFRLSPLIFFQPSSKSFYDLFQNSARVTYLDLTKLLKLVLSRATIPWFSLTISIFDKLQIQDFH